MPQLSSDHIHEKGALVSLNVIRECGVLHVIMVWSSLCINIFTMLLQGSLLCEAVEAKAEESLRVLLACCSSRDVNSGSTFKDMWVCDRIENA